MTLHQQQHTRIGISDVDGEYCGRYVRWLSSIDGGIVAVPLLSAGDPVEALASCSALLLPGGGDPDPSLYGKTDPDGLCDIEAERDHQEFQLIRAAIDSRLPILGICRGLQIMNVALGGSLHVDLVRAGMTDHHKRDGKDRLHDIRIETGSLLHRVTQLEQATVNSSHHQGVDLVAPRLRATSRTEDGLPESLEWKFPDAGPFLLLVHWHPERLHDPGGALTRAIGGAFLAAAASRASEPSAA